MTTVQTILQNFNEEKSLRLKQFLCFAVLVMIYYIFLYLNGFFQIGWLSDSYEDMYFAVNTSVFNIFKGNVHFGRYRPLLFLILKILYHTNSVLGFDSDNFIFFNITSSLLYLFSGVIIYKLLRLFSVERLISTLASLIVLFYPNNIHNLAWSAAFFEILSLIVYLLSIYFTVMLLKTENSFFIPLVLLLFVLGILLKETNLTIPLTGILFVFLLGHNLKGKEMKILFGIEFFLISIYAALKFFVLNHSLNDALSLNFSNIYKLLIKIYISYLVPGDYIEILLNVFNYNLLTLGYLVMLVLILTLIFLKQKANKNFLIIFIMSLILVSPNIYAGYLRPQLILIPFSILFTGIVFTVSRKFKHYYTVIIMTLFLCLFMWLSAINIRDWKETYVVMKNKMEVMLENKHGFSGNDVLVGNTSRIKQCFLFDNPTFIFNYWKYKQVSFVDTVNSYLSTVSSGEFDNNIPIKCYASNDSLILSVNHENGYFADDEHNKQNSDEYEIQFFGKIKILERNRFQKTTKVQVLLYNKNLNLYYMDESKLKSIIL